MKIKKTVRYLPRFGVAPRWSAWVNAYVFSFKIVLFHIQNLKRNIKKKLKQVCMMAWQWLEDISVLCFLLMFQKPVVYGRQSTVSTSSDPSGYLSASLSEWELALQEIHMFIRTHTFMHTSTHNFCFKAHWTFSLNCWPCLFKIVTWRSEKHDHVHSCLVPSSLCQWCYKQGQHLWWQYQIRLKPTFFCSSLVRNELMWLCS